MNELYHYGIKRRSGRYPWGSGERPFQSANRSEIKKLERGKERSQIFRSERTIPKGTKVYYITNELKNKQKSTSVSYLNSDRNRAINISSLNKKKSYEKELVLVEDLKIPSRNHLSEVIDDKISKNPKLLDSAIDTLLKDVYGDDYSGYFDSEDERREVIKDESKVYETLFERVSSGLKNQPLDIQFSRLVYSFKDDNELKKEVISELKKEGYNGIVDEGNLSYMSADIANNIYIYPKGSDPLIVFDLDNTTKEISNREITEKDREKASSKHVKWFSNGRKRQNIW